MIIAVDFDGTLCEQKKFPAIGPPKFEVLNAVIKMKKAGHQIILWTCRGKDYINEVVAWCKSYGLEFDAVNEDLQRIKDLDFGKNKSCKVYADIYLDDKSITINQFIDDEIKNLYIDMIQSKLEK